MLPWTFSAFDKADLLSAARLLASAASTPVAAAYSTKVWQLSVTWVATLAAKAPTSRAGGGGGAGPPPWPPSTAWGSGWGPYP